MLIQRNEKNHSINFNLTIELARQLERANAPIKSDPNTIYDLYINSSVEVQNQFLHKCQFYTELIKSAIDSDIAIVNDKRFIWLTLMKLNCIPSSELMELIKDGDAVELYSMDGKLIFSNFDFCKHTTYTIEELFWFSWDKLFGREEIYMNQVMTEFIKATSYQKPFVPKVERHAIWEIQEGHNKKGFVEMKVFSHLKSKVNGLNYVLATSNVDS